MKPAKVSKRLRDWPRADIIAALHKKGLSLRQLAKIHGCGVSTLSMALRGPAAPSEDLIAAALGLSPSVLWPSRFNPDGTRLDLRQQSRCPHCGYVYPRSANEAGSVKHLNTKSQGKARSKKTDSSGDSIPTTSGDDMQEPASAALLADGKQT